MQEFLTLVVAIIAAVLIRGVVRNFAQRVQVKYGIHPLLLWLIVVVAFTVIMAVVIKVSR